VRELEGLKSPSGIGGMEVIPLAFPSSPADAFKLEVRQPSAIARMRVNFKKRVVSIGILTKAAN